MSCWTPCQTWSLMSVCQQWTFNDCRPRVTSDRDDRALQCLVRRMPFATSPVLKQHWLPNRRRSVYPNLCVFPHQSADYSIVVAHLTSNSFEGHPCCMHADYLPSLCFWYSPSYHAYWEWISFYCSQPTGAKTHTNQQCEGLAKIRQTTDNIWSWRQGIAAFG
jgi:hypothetical protein